MSVGGNPVLDERIEGVDNSETAEEFVGEAEDDAFVIGDGIDEEGRETEVLS